MRRTSITLAALLALLATACGGGESTGAAGGDGTEPTGMADGTEEVESTTEAAAGGGADFSVGLALAGPRNDRGFYQSHFEGVESAAEQHGFEYSVVDSLEDPQGRLDALKNLAADSELVIGGGAAFADAGNAVAEQFPDTTFIVSAGVTDPEIPNLHSYVANQGATGYLAGFAAAEMTESNKVGFIGGAEIPPTFLSDQFFEAAIAEELPDAEYVSTVIGSFSDAAQAKEAATAQIASDTDVIYAFLDAGLPGVLQAIEESGEDVKVVNPITNRCEESDQLLGYTFLNANLLVETMVNDYVDGNLPDGTKTYLLEDTEIQDFQLCPAFEDQLGERVSAIRTELQEGERDFPEPEG